MPNKYRIWEGDTTPPKDIFEAAERGDLAFITRILERTVHFDVNLKDSLARTPLHWAAELGHVDCAKVLLEFGADVHATECNGRTAIHLAARSVDAAMLQVLLAASDTKTQEQLVNQTDFFGITPVFLSMQKAEEGYAALELLIGCGAKLSDPALSKVY